MYRGMYTWKLYPLSYCGMRRYLLIAPPRRWACEVPDYLRVIAARHDVIIRTKARMHPGWSSR